MKKDFINVIYLFMLLALVLICYSFVCEIRRVQDINNMQDTMINIMRREQDSLQKRLDVLSEQINHINRYVRFPGG